MLQTESMAQFMHQGVAQLDMVSTRVGIKGPIVGVQYHVAARIGQEVEGQCTARTIDGCTADADIASNAQLTSAIAVHTAIVIGFIDVGDPTQLDAPVKRIGKEVKPRLLPQIRFAGIAIKGVV